MYGCLTPFLFLFGGLFFLGYFLTAPVVSEIVPSEIAPEVVCAESGSLVSAYTASGMGWTEEEVNQTDTFGPQDDLKLVVQIAPHSCQVQVYAQFYDPSNTAIGPQIEVTLLAETDTVVLGLEWQTTTRGEPWTAGEWRVEVSVGGISRTSLNFQVNN